MVARVLAFFVWALVAAGVVGWGLKLSSDPTAMPAQTVLAQAGLPAAGDWTRVLGAAPAAVAPAAPPPDARFRLLGVVAPRGQVGSAQGVALIAVDGKPARALRVGAVVEGEQVLQAVQARAVAIGPRHGAPTLRLELPPLPPPTAGLPSAAPPGMPPGVPPPAPQAQAAVLPQAQPIVPAPSPSPAPAAVEPAAPEAQTAPRYGRPQQR